MAYILLTPMATISNPNKVAKLYFKYLLVTFFTTKYNKNPYIATAIIECPLGKEYPPCFINLKTLGLSL